MCNEPLHYKPHGVYKYFAIGLLILLFFLVCVFSIFVNIEVLLTQTLFLSLLSVTCIILAKVIYDGSKVQVIFEEDCLRCIGMDKTGYRVFSWDALPYGYLFRSSHGHMFLILANAPLDKKVMGRFVNLSFYSQICKTKQGFEAMVLALSPAVLDFAKNKMDIQKIK